MPPEVLKFESPLYWAVTECGLPSGVRLFIAHVAVLPVIVATGWLIPSIMNVTVPVGVPDPGETAATVAVNVTFCPETLGFWLDVTVVVVFDLFTTCAYWVLVEVLKFVSP